MSVLSLFMVDGLCLLGAAVGCLADDGQLEVGDLQSVEESSDVLETKVAAAACGRWGQS